MNKLKKTIILAMNNHDLNKVIKNSGWLLLDRLCRLGIGLIVNAWVARYLGPNEYGELAFVLAYLAFFQAVSILGLDNIIVRDASNNKIDTGKLIGTTFALRLLSGVILFLLSIVIISSSYGLSSRITLITCLCASSLIFQSSDVIDLWFQSQSQSKRTVIVKLTAYIISNGVRVILILNECSLTYFAAVMVLEGVLSLLGLFIAYNKYPTNKWVICKDTAFRLIKESWPFIFSSLSVIIYMRLDQLMIKSYLGDKELGIYAAVLPLAMVWTFIPITLTTSFAPYVSKLKIKGEEYYWNCLRQLFRLYAILGWLISLFVVFIAPLAVSILFGSEYEKGVLILQITIFTNLFIFLGLAQSLWIINEGKSKLAMYRTFFGAIVCVILNITLIPIYGVYGAAFSSVIAQASSTVISNFFISRKILKLQLKSLCIFF